MTIPLFKVFMSPTAADAARLVLESGYIGQGPAVERFERVLGPWCGSDRSCRPLAVSSGTAALALALRLADVQHGDEVVTTPMTCFATTAAILDRGAVPVWCDIDPWTGDADPESVRRALTPRTRAVLVVDWGGYPCDYTELLAYTRQAGVHLIEDAAHALGAVYKGELVGAWADLTAYSFQAIKTLTTVDGGALACLSRSEHRRGKLLRWFGIDRENKQKTDLRCEVDIPEAGWKYHMNDVAAAIGLENLSHVPGLLARQRANADFYFQELSDLKRVRLLRYAPDRQSSYWLFTVRVPDRESFRAHLEARGIASSQVHVRTDRHTATAAFRRDLPGVDEFAREQVSIPVGWWVSDEERERIAAAIREWCGP